MPVRRCSYCTSSFSKVEHLKRHERSHTGEKPYQCKKCGKRFARGDVLNRHLKGHHERDSSGTNSVKSAGRELTSPVTREPLAEAPIEDSVIVRAPDSPAHSLEQNVHQPAHQQQNPQPQVAQSPLTSVLPIDPQLELESMLHSVVPISPAASNHQRRQADSPSDGQDHQSHPAPHHENSSPYARQNDDELQTIFSLPYEVSAMVPENALSDEEVLNVLGVGDHNGASVDFISQLASLGDGLQTNTNIHSPLGRFDPNISGIFNRDMGQFLANYGNRVRQSPGLGEPAWLSGFDSISTPQAPPPRVPSTRPLSISNPVPLEPTKSRTRRASSFASDFPEERFAKMAKLWPKKVERPWQLVQTIWADAVGHQGGNLYSESFTNGFQDFPSPGSADGWTGIDEEKQRSLAKEYGVPGYSGERDSKNMRFPSADTLGLCMELYFHRFHPLLPVIHEATFNPNTAPNMIVMPICLLGLFLLDPDRTRGFVAAHLSHGIDKCYAALSRPWKKSDATTLITVLTSALLFLNCATSMQERMHTQQTYALYAKAVSIAQQNSLFEADKGPSPATVLPRERTDDSSWKAWTRVESCKRMVAAYIMLDSFFSSNMGTSPIIRVDTMKYYVPCSASLFTATDATRWAQLDPRQSMNPSMIDLRPQKTNLPPGSLSSSFAMYSLQCAVWLRFSDLRHRFILQDKNASHEPTLFPGELYRKDASGASLAPLLKDIYSYYRNDPALDNPNCLVFWNNMFISLTANLEVFELAAGREGVDSARAALDNISIWAQTPQARRACLHAAQTYACMSRRKMAHGTMFLTESTLFSSALVLGLYLYVKPDALQPAGRTDDVVPLELLDDVDWSEVGEGGLPGRNSSGGGNGDGAATQARRWIAEGGPVTFGGVSHGGGYSSSRRLMLAYVGLLEEVGRWNVGEFCRILRIMSDTPADLDGVGGAAGNSTLNAYV